MMQLRHFITKPWGADHCWPVGAVGIDSNRQRQGTVQLEPLSHLRLIDHLEMHSDLALADVGSGHLRISWHWNPRNTSAAEKKKRYCIYINKGSGMCMCMQGNQHHKQQIWRNSHHMIHMQWQVKVSLFLMFQLRLLESTSERIINNQNASLIDSNGWTTSSFLPEQRNEGQKQRVYNVMTSKSMQSIAKQCAPSHHGPSICASTSPLSSMLHKECIMLCALQAVHHKSKSNKIIQDLQYW